MIDSLRENGGNSLHANRIRIHLHAHRDNPDAGEDVWRRVMRAGRVIE